MKSRKLFQQILINTLNAVMLKNKFRHQATRVKRKNFVRSKWFMDRIEQMCESYLINTAFNVLNEITSNQILSYYHWIRIDARGLSYLFLLGNHFWLFFSHLLLINLKKCRNNLRIQIYLISFEYFIFQL